MSQHARTRLLWDDGIDNQVILTAAVRALMVL